LAAETPQYVTGEAVFTSYDGLRAEANGALGALTFDCRALEMRNERILDALPSAKSDSALFLQSLDMRDGRIPLVGLVGKITDFNRRPGIIGACVSLSKKDRELVSGSMLHLHELFSTILRATFDRWAGRSLPERLGLLDGVPRRETRSDYRFKAGTELLHMVDEGEAELCKDIMVACLDLTEASEGIGRALVLRFAAGGTKPADRRFVEYVRGGPGGNAARIRPRETGTSTAGGPMARQERNAREGWMAGIDDLIRRQDMIERRLASLEWRLKIHAPAANAGIAPTGTDFARPRVTPRRGNAVATAAAAGLPLLLVLSVAAWLLFRGPGADVDTRQPVAESSSPEPSDVGRPNSSDRTSAALTADNSGPDVMNSSVGGGTSNSSDQAPFLPAANSDPDAEHPDTGRTAVTGSEIDCNDPALSIPEQGDCREKASSEGLVIKPR